VETPSKTPKECVEPIEAPIIVAYGVAIMGTSTVALFLCLALWRPLLLTVPPVAFFWGLGLVRGSLFAVRRAREAAWVLAVVIVYGGCEILQATDYNRAIDLVLALVLPAGMLFLVALPIWRLGRRYQRRLRNGDRAS